MHEVLRRAAAHAEAYRAHSAIADAAPARNYAGSLAAFDAPLPQTGSDPAQVIDDLERLALPGLRNMTGPRFFGWVIGASHPAGVAADWMVSAWGQNAGNHVASPSSAAVETVAMRWLLDLFDLPREASVGFVTGATMANFVCLAAARGEMLRRVGWDVEAQGLFGAPELHVILGADAHSTVFSALQYLGLGHDRVRRVATGAQGQVLPEAFAAALADVTGPALAILQSGQINTGACDPLDALIPLARARGAWVHVDGAFGLWARACPEVAAQAAGAELADSWACDGHKWLQTPYDCGYAIVRDAAAHARAMTIAASYLPVVEAGERDPSHYVPELSRRARGFATWAMIRTLGRDGIAEMIARHCRLARRMAATLAAEPGVVVVNQVVLNQIIVRFGDDAGTRATIRRVQEDGIIFAGGATWRGQWVMRLSVISGGIDDAEADKSAAAILSAWRAVQAAG